MGFAIFMGTYSHQQWILEHFYYFRKKPHALCSVPYPPAPPPPTFLNNHESDLSLSIFLSWTVVWMEWHHACLFCLASFTEHNVLHAVAGVTSAFPFVDEQFPISWICHVLSVHSPTEGHWVISSFGQWWMMLLETSCSVIDFTDFLDCLSFLHFHNLHSDTCDSLPSSNAVGSSFSCVLKGSLGYWFETFLLYWSRHLQL